MSYEWHPTDCDGSPANVQGLEHCPDCDRAEAGPTDSGLFPR
jgi:hypothetical protein